MTRLEDCNHKWVDISTLSDRIPKSKCVKCRAVRYGIFNEEVEVMSEEDSASYEKKFDEDTEDGAMRMLGYMLIFMFVAGVALLGWWLWPG